MEKGTLSESDKEYICKRLDKIGDYIDPKNLEGMGAMNDLLYQHIDNNDRAAKATGLNKAINNWIITVTISLGLLIGTALFYGIQALYLANNILNTI